MSRQSYLPFIVHMAYHFTVLPLDILQLLDITAEELVQNNKEPLRILRLPHPRTGLSSLFLPQEWLPSAVEMPIKTGMLELQAVCPPDERSWVLGEEVISDGKMLTVTPIDPAFLLLPIIQSALLDNGSAVQFRTSDDLFEAAARFADPVTGSNTFTPLHDDIIRFCSLECTKKALARICEVKELSSELVVYRYSAAKLMKYLRAKVANLEKCNSFDGSRTLIRNLAKDALMEDGQEILLKLGRTRASCDLVGQYLSSEMRDALFDSYDFSMLQKHVESIREEAISKAVAAPVPKNKGKAQDSKDNAKKRKSTKASHGVETLKKANTNGMANISSFFNKTK